MPHLQMHQLRVAAVVAKICDTFSISINKTAIITAALVHDMGNLIKSDFSTNYFALTPQEIDYWEGVKKEFIEKYGNNVHEATLSILKEIRKYKQSKGCQDCSETDPIVLEFDHREPSKKEVTIGTVIRFGWSLERLMKEIEKCDVVCANCHRRTAKMFWLDD